MWQDWILMIGGFAFSIALIPSILSKNKPSKLTSLGTCCALFAFSICYITLDLIMATISTSLTAFCWLVLFIQGVNNGKEKKSS